MSRDLDMGGLTFVFVDSKNEVLETTKVGRKFLIVKRRKTESRKGRITGVKTYYEILIRAKRKWDREVCQLTNKEVIKGELYWSSFNYQPNYDHSTTSLTSNFEQAMKVIDCFKKHPNWFDKPRGIFANNRYYSNGWKTRDSGIDWKREYGW
tara:strand:- start:294 stop:749 length:456 start_codon:yes stop_codon:yes gene_type:complete